MKNFGYKEMLRDRCPAVVNFALKWCNAKERWIDHAYCRFIKIYVDKKEKKHTARIILGIAKYYRNFEFDKSIDWDNLTDEEITYWKWVSQWVRWFTTNFAYIENTYKVSRSCGKEEFDCKVEIIQTYLSEMLPKANDENPNKKLQSVNKLTDYLIKCIESIKLMFSVFSNYLEPLREANLIALTDNPKVSDIYNQLRIAYNQGSIGVLNTTRMIAPITEDEDNYDIVEEVWRNPYLQKELQWINKNITLEIGIQDYRRLGVCLSIADNKIMKLIREKKLDKKFYERIHYYLCNNTWNEHRLIVNEGLPFLG